MLQHAGSAVQHPQGLSVKQGVRRRQSVTSEKELLSSVLAGDWDAFRLLVERFQGLVGHIVFRLVKEPDDRADLCQEVFLRVYRHLPHFRGECKLSTWIAQIAYNTCLNWLQKKRPDVYGLDGEDNVSLDELPGHLPSPEETATRQDLAAHLEQEIMALPLPYRTILTLYHVEEMSYEEIGRVMGFPQGTVKSYLFRARRRLKERLLSRYGREEL
ncbi:MAG: sigma-70 family RNA polymerase sigma factor [candidate division KSB1 bacterium]|nr:sigma-70 family RNA polymerase sigma factor [candidate division KSB1 bacterium]MDZ7294864.1 sigma-70 family RNA polymerase sigma factor [candidate division KSB1 bacterium]MDZ7377971.1 sigma-70 family RNA polymerase sigma factor [candidate division KSB1 bacterium]MDZ7393271.1 sigma-70 family RNA polymerase sigma factor [candidate division KSB1 bacterium]MDZ7412357.1 sigma-70 family RNA polymerase sigma factor [candidate division KSB1 bacterium]